MNIQDARCTSFLGKGVVRNWRHCQPSFVTRRLCRIECASRVSSILSVDKGVVRHGVARHGLYVQHRDVRACAKIGNVNVTPGSVSEFFSDTVRPYMTRCIRMLVYVWKTRLEEWHKRMFLRVMGLLGGLLVVQVSLNIWMVPKLNKALPSVAKSLSKTLRRDVSIHRIDWVAPTGLAGLHPVGRVRGVSVGPGSTEKSHASIDTLDVHFNPFKSVLYGRIMLSTKSEGAEFHLKQAENFSWFGFPDDTTPSSRFVPPAAGGGGSRNIESGVRVSASQSLSSNSFENKRIASLDGLLRWHQSKSQSLEQSFRQHGDYTYENIFICSSTGSGRGSDSRNDLFREQGQLAGCEESEHVPSTSGKLNANLSSLTIDLDNLYSLKPLNTVSSQLESESDASKNEKPVSHPHSIDLKKLSALNNLNVRDSTELDESVTSEMKAKDSFKFYTKLVEDPGTLKKKMVGSKALQKARNWTPAVPKHNLDAQGTMRAPLSASNGAKSIFSGTKSIPKRYMTTDSKKNATPGKLKKTVTIEKPAYTPAPPEAFFERKYKKSVFKYLLEAISNIVVQRISLESFVCQHGTLYGYIYDEPLPRTFRNVVVKSRFSGNYNKLRIDITAEPDKRSLDAYRWTMKTPTAPQHLRDCIGSDYYKDFSNVFESIDKDETGGKLAVHIEADNVVKNDMLAGGPIYPFMKIAINGKNLHAPLIERIVELPIDIKTGRLDGNFIISSDDASSWAFPKFNGRVAVRNANFHFWDSSDEIINSAMDLIFEGDRVYLHKATGYFGAVPLKVTGDLDMNPLYGEYRVSASVPSVEINALRATLGVRPTPFPVSGAVSGTMHVTGPLEKPVFSGHAHIQRPTQEMIARAEPSLALDALQATQSAVGAYERVPFQEAGAVFSLDTATNEMVLHALHGDLVDGGQLQGAGKMNVAPSAELDPSALDIIVRGSDINQEALAKRYLPEVALPLELGKGLSSGTVAMRGAHLSPVINTIFSVSNGAQGSVRFQRESTSLEVSSPHFEASGSVYLNPPSYASMKSAVTQAQASDLAKPNFTGCSMNVNMKGFDMIPFLSDNDAVRNLSKTAGEPLKLRVNGRVKLDGDVKNTKVSEYDGKEGKSGWQFSGSLGFEDIRLNQMKLYRDLKGTIELNDQKLSAHGKGMRPDETLDIEVDLPLISDKDRKEAKSTFGDSYMNLRYGKLQASGAVVDDGASMDFRIANIKLDELELASLRGDLQEISCAVNFKTQTGRGRASILAPKYSGIQGESLSGGFRWEKDVFRLEKIALQQKQSRYELQGEYVLPSSFQLPSNAADLLCSDESGFSQSGANGRWRLRVDAPYAEIQDLTPAGRFLQSVNDQFPADYERAKNGFMGALTSASVRLNDLNENLNVLMGPVNPKSGFTSEPKHADINLHFDFPALQTSQGFWKGSIQAFGGGEGATSCDFDIRGQNWVWGDAILDSFVAKGSGHSEDGIQLQEFVLNAGDAKLLIRGSLLNDNQDATLLLTDFPVSTLRPVFQAIPALQYASPAVSAHEPEPIASPLPLGIIASTMSKMSDKEEAETSPINGQLFMSGSLTGSKDSPSANVTMRVYEAVVGRTRLSNAQASAQMTDGSDLSFDVNIVPLDGQRSSGQIVASGKVPLQHIFKKSGKVESDSAELMDINLNIRDGGMAVVTSISPSVRWRQGSADLTANISGRINNPVITGEAHISKALLDCPVLKYPLNLVTADIRCKDDTVMVKGVDARVGRKGRIRIRGTLPIKHDHSIEGMKNSRITLDLHGLELKARNVYTGQLDALLTARDSVERPIIGGSMRFSKGSLLLNPQGQDLNASSQTFEDNVSDINSPVAPSVSKVFTLLTKGDTGLATQLESAVKNEVEAMEMIVEESTGSNAVLDGLAVQFGPDLRALYPLVMNFAVNGELVASGPAHIDSVTLSGSLRLPSGDINLLAAQFELDRDHENLIMFGATGNQQSTESNRQEQVGIDPLVDISLNSGDLKVSVTGKASEWSEHLTMQSAGRGSSGMDAGEKLDALEAAKLLESKLKAALLADNGQIALNKLAGTTMATFMPKIETQGSVGDTKWRLVSAPSVPGLLDPRETSASNVLDFLALGAEVEVSFGKKLQAAMVRKLRESDVMTKWTLNYNLNTKLRMQFDVSSAPPYPKTLTFQYSSEGGE